MSHARRTQRRHTWMRTLKLEELEQRLLLNGDPGISSVQASYSLADLDGTDGFVLEGIDEEDISGYSVSTVGDVNGDGYDDFVIGAPSADPDGNNNTGESYVVFGKSESFGTSVDLSTLNGSTGFVLKGVDPGDQSGISVSSAGDVNGDGYNDILIGANLADPGGTLSAGKTYVVFGKASGFTESVNLSLLDGTTGFVLNGIDDTDNSGQAVATAGDVNGDGYSDILIGARMADYSEEYTDTGESYLIFGRASGFSASVDLSSLDGVSGTVFNGLIGNGSLIGFSVSTAGDVNGDGYADILIGAAWADFLLGVNTGAAYVVFGQTNGFGASLDLASLDGTKGFVLKGVDAEDYTGASVNSAGDINGDGYDDILIGAKQADPDGDTDAGETYVVFGKSGSFGASLDLSSLDGTNGFVLEGIDASDYSGSSVSTAGDVNGDGYDDVLIGAYYADPNGSMSGETYLVFGKSESFDSSLDLSTLNGTNGITFKGVDAENYSGRSVSTTGDVSGDGYDDILISAPWADLGENSMAGETYLYYGRDFTGAVTQEGTDADEIFWGTAAADVIVAGDGNDRLVGLGGADRLAGGAGDDELVIGSVDFQRVSGGNGTDTLEVYGRGRTLDLTSIADSDVTGIEAIDLTGSGNNTLILNYLEVLNLSDTSNTLTVTGDVGDSVDLGTGWTEVGSSGSQKRFTQGAATVLVDDSLTLSGDAPVTDQQDFAGLYRDGQWFMDLDDEGGVGESIMFYGISTDIPIVGDWDGDGIDDLAIYRAGQWLFDDNNDGIFAESAFWFGLPGDIPAAGDFDGNGVDEVAVYRNGLWFMDLAGDGFISEKMVWFGLPGDVPVTADFDGNGLDDAAVYRNGQWFIDLAGDGGIGEKSYWFGLPGDVPVTGDWNEDGLDNAAVYRSGQWFFDFDGEGYVSEKSFWFGLPTDRPVAGRWPGSTSASSAGNASNIVPSAVTEDSEAVPEAMEYNQPNHVDPVNITPSVFDGMTVSRFESELYFREDEASLLEDDSHSDDDWDAALEAVTIDLSQKKR